MTCTIYILTPMTQISNFILKSRHDYNEDYICKYVSENVAITSYMNHEIWMNKIENLNDDREGNVLKELFENSQWKNIIGFENRILPLLGRILSHHLQNQ